MVQVCLPHDGFDGKTVSRLPCRYHLNQASQHMVDPESIDRSTR